MTVRASRRVARDRSGRRLPAVPGLRHERRYWDLDLVVAGIDEVGRGAYAGPVTYAAVVLPSDRRMYKLRDSKLLSPAAREHLATRLRGFAEGIGVGRAAPAEIDELGMSDAMRLGAERALAALPVRPDVVLVDGNWDFTSGAGVPAVTLVHGDAHSASIAAASIVAKVTRDAELARCDPLHPAYGFASNKGYPSPDHLAALDEHGPCALHRHSWAPIRALAARAADDGSTGATPIPSAAATAQG